MTVSAEARRAASSAPGHTGRRHRAYLVLVLCAFAVGGSAAQEVAPEYQLKAAFIAKYPEFTEWPPAVLAARKTIDICVAQPNPFGRTLSEFVAGEVLGGRNLQVREISAPADLASCQVLFVPAQSAVERKVLLAAAQKLPLLTVGESPTFLDDGGIVNLRLIEGRVRFDVNVAVADRVGIRFSSQLLRLASNVRGRPS